MLKKILQTGKWKVLSIAFSILTIVALSSTIFLALREGDIKKTDPTPMDTVYDDAYFDVNNQIELNYLVIKNFTADQAPDKKTAGNWLMGINLTKTFASSGGDETLARANYFSTHYLEVPTSIVGIDMVSERVTDGNLPNGTKVSFNDTFVYSLIKAVRIPMNVRYIKTGSLYGMTSLEYLKSPFVGTSRGSSGRGLNYTLTEIAKHPEPTSDCFGSMFGHPLDYGHDHYEQGETCLWPKWDTATSSVDYVKLNDPKNPVTDMNSGSELYATWWQEIADDTTYKKFNYLIPKSLKEVIIYDDSMLGNNCFTGCTSTSISIPSFSGSSLLIGSYAFSECAKATEITLPTTKNVSFRKGAFNMCQSLEKLILPPGLTQIPDAFLYNANKLNTIIMPSSILEIGDAAFKTCSSLKKIALYSGSTSLGIEDENSPLVEQSVYDFNFPKALVEIGTDAFSDCQNLTSLYLPSTVQKIGYNAFGGCYSIKEMDIPFIGAHKGSCTDDCAVDKLGGEPHLHKVIGWIFGDVGSVERFYPAVQCYTNSSGVTEQKTFYIPKTLETIRITGETYVSPGALQNLKSLVNLSINKEVGSSVSHGCLNGCANLESLSISSITEHLGYLFKGANFDNSSETYNGGRVPNSLVTLAVTNQYSIPTNAFYNCTHIENVTIEKETRYMDSAIFYNNPALTSLTIPFKGYERGEFYRYWWWWYDKAIRNSVAWLFSTTNHTSTYPNNAIRYYNTRYIPTSLKSLTVTDDTEIDTYAFRGFSSLESISITNVPNHIENYSFYGCSSLKQIQIPYIGYDLNRNGVQGGSHTLGYIFGSSSYEGAYEANQYWGTYYIPESLAIVNVGASGREEVKMSNKIFNHAFQNCSSITTVNFYDAQINELGSYAFAGCSKLSSVSYPGAQYSHVGDYAFYKCPKVLCIEDFTPDTVTTIGNYSFNGTSIGNKVANAPGTTGTIDLSHFSSIGDYAFGNCLQIENVIIPATVKSIGEGLFSGCTYLNDVTILNKMASPYMFENCTRLVGITLADVVTSIPEGMFSGCTSLEVDTPYNNGLILDENTSYIGNYAFRNCPSLTGFIIGNKVNTIDYGAFQGCTGLEYMTIPRDVEYIDYDGWINCNDNFFFYVYEPEERWSSGWVKNWNCDYPVYVLGSIRDDIFTYTYDTTEKKFYITGVTPTATLTGIITIPTSHNGIQVIGIDESRRTEEDIAAGAKDIRSQSGITKIILPKAITKIVGEPFKTGSRVDVYTELTKAEVTEIYNASYAELEATYNEWVDKNPNATSTQRLNERTKIFKGLKGWLPGTENAQGVTYWTPATSNSWDSRDWVSAGILYYKDYWTYGSNVTGNVPYLDISKFKYTLYSNIDLHYTGNPIEQYVFEVQLPGEIKVDGALNITEDLLKISAMHDVLIPSEAFKIECFNNVNVGTATIQISSDSEMTNQFNDLFNDLPENIASINHPYLFTGKASLHYKILKSKLVVVSSSGVASKYYDGNPYSYSSWVAGEIQGLEGFPGARFTGTLESRSPNKGLYSFATKNLYWSSPWAVYLGGQDITNNFEIEVGYAAEILPVDVELVWTKQWYEGGIVKPVSVLSDLTHTTSDGKDVPVVQYPYVGATIRPYAAAKLIGTDRYLTYSECPITTGHIDTNRQGIYPYIEGTSSGTEYEIYAYLRSGNFILKELQDDGSYAEPEQINIHGSLEKAVRAAYRVGKGLITIDINTTYKLSPTEDYWQKTWGFSLDGDGNAIPERIDMDGKGVNSFFIGAIRTSRDLLGQYSYSFHSTDTPPYRFEDTSENSITWTNAFPGEGAAKRIYRNYDKFTINFMPTADQPYIIYNPSLGIADETPYYDVILNVRVEIRYSDFNLRYFFGEYTTESEYMKTRYPNYIVEPTTKTVTTEGNTREYEYFEYMVDGRTFKLTVEDWNAFTKKYPEYQVTYYRDEGSTIGLDGPTITEIGDYVYGVQVTARHYNTLVKNIWVKTVKSNVIVDALDKYYDRNPIDPLGDGKILKIGEDQRVSIKFTYFDVNGNQLTSAPKDVGTYSVKIEAPEGQYFNAYNRTIRFKILKRPVYITMSGSKTFDQMTQSYTPNTLDLMTSEDNPNGGLLEGDEFLGTLITSSFIPGTYRYTNEGTYSIVWSPNWQIIDSYYGDDVSGNYDVRVSASYKINPLKFRYTATGYNGPYTGYFYSATITMEYPTPDNFDPAFTPDVKIQYSASPLSADSTDWMDTAPYYATPGIYRVYYKISADYFQTVVGSVQIKIDELTITYQDSAMTDSDGNNKVWTLEYDGAIHTYDVTVTSPEFGYTLTYSTDGAIFTEDAPQYTDYGTYTLWFKIEAPYHKTVLEQRTVKLCYDIDDPDHPDPTIPDDPDPDHPDDPNLKKIDYYDPAEHDNDRNKKYWTIDFDGKQHTYKIDVLDPETGATVYYHYSDMEAGAFTTTPRGFTNVGEYEVLYKIEADGYNTVGPVRRYVIICDENTKRPDPVEPMRFADGDFYANYFKGVYDGLDHSVEADFSADFKASGVNWISILYSVDGGGTWTKEKPTYSAIGSHPVWVKFAADGYQYEIVKGSVVISSMTLDIYGEPLTVTYDGQSHMITLNSDTAVLRFDDTTKTYWYLAAGMTEEVELTFLYSTNPNLSATSSAWLPTVEYVDGKAVLRGPVDAGTYPIYFCIKADKYETLISNEYNRLQINRLEHPDITMDSPQEIEYSKKPLDPEKIKIETVSDGERTYTFYEAHYDPSGNPTTDSPKVRITPPEELGLYYVTIDVAETKNCGPCSVSGYIKIVPKQLEVKYTNPQYYDGTVKGPDAYVETGTTDEIHVVSSIRGTKQPIEVGVYTFDVVMVENNPNYVLKNPTIEMEIRKRNVLFLLEENHLVKTDGSLWTHLDSNYYDKSNQVGDNRWHLLGDLSGTRTVIKDGKEVEVTYSGLANRHAIYAELETAYGTRGTYFYSNISNEFYINKVKLLKFDIYQIDAQGNFVLGDDDQPISVLDYYDVDYFLRIALQNPPITEDVLTIVKDYTYDGLGHTLQVSMPDHMTGSYVRFEGVDGYYGAIPPQFITVGDYEVKYLVGAAGYEETYYTTVLTIHPADLEIEVGDLYKEADSYKSPHNIYDDTYHINDYSVTNILSGAIPKADKLRYYSAKDYTFDEIVKLYQDILDSESDDALEGYTCVNRLIDAGDYYLVIYIPQDYLRWNASYVIVNIQLKPRDIFIEMLNMPNFIKTYDGTPITIPLTTATIDMNRTDTAGLCTNHTLDLSENRLKQYTVRTNSADAGDYDLLTQFEFENLDIRRTDGTKVDASNYHPVIHGNFIVRIEKAYLRDGDFTVEEFTEKVYDGYRHEPTYTCISDGELEIKYYLIDEDGNSTELIGNQKDVGHYRMEITVLEGKNYRSLLDSYYTNDPDTGNPYFSSPFLEAELVCTPKEVEVSWSDLEQDFTGSPLAAKAWFMDNETDHEHAIRVDLNVAYWDNVTYQWIPTVVNQGTHLCLATIDDTTSVGQSYLKNYRLTDDTNLFTINYMTLLIHLGDGPDPNNIIYYNTQTEWHSYLYKEATKDAAELYSESEKVQAWLNTVTISSLADVQERAFLTTKGCEIGTYRDGQFDINCKIVTKDGVDVTPSIQFKVIGSVTIKSDDIDYTVRDVTLMYNEGTGDSSSVGYTFEDLNCITVVNPKSGVHFDHFVINGQSYGSFFPRIADAGEYTIEFSISADGGQYTTCRDSVQVTILPREAYMVFAKGLTKKYDGLPVDILNLLEEDGTQYGFNGNLSDLNIEYFELILENGKYVERTIESAPSDAGKYVVHVTSNMDSQDGQKNYTTLDVRQTFDITAKEVNLVIDKDIELLNDELLDKEWQSELYTFTAGDNPYIASYEMLQFSFSTSLFKRGDYKATQILKATGSAEQAKDEFNMTKIVTSENKEFTASWRFIKTDEKGNILYQTIGTDPSDPDAGVQVPYDVSTNYMINLDFSIVVHYPYIPLEIEGEEVTYDGNSHHGTIQFSDYTSADTTIHYSADWFATNSTQLYSLSQDDLVNNPDICANSITDSLVSFTDPGSYTIYYKIDVKDGITATKFESMMGSFVIFIDKLERTVTEEESLTKEYDAQPAGEIKDGTRYFPKFNVTTAPHTAPDSYTWDEISIVYQQAGYNSMVPADKGCINTGVYQYVLTIPETKYYKASVLQSSFMITKVKIYVENARDPLPGKSFEYDSLVKRVKVDERSTDYNLLVKNQGTPTPIWGLDLTFNATFVTRSAQVGTYKGSDSSLYLENTTYELYDIDGNDVSMNYTIDFSKATIEIRPIQIHYSINHPTYVYDNLDHPFSYIILQPTNTRLVTVEWYNEDRKEWQYQPIRKRMVGEYEAKVRLSAENYETVELTLPLTITRAETIIDYVSNLSRVYDGNEVTIPEIINTNRDKTHEGTMVNTYTYRYYKYNADGTLNPQPIYEQSYNPDSSTGIDAIGERPVDVGKYRMEIVIPESDNYGAVTYNDDFTISSYITDLTWENVSFVYNGNPQKPTAYLQLVPTDKGQTMNIQIRIDVTPMKADGDPNYTNRGTYRATASLDYAASDPKISNYLINDISKSVMFTIKPRSTKISVNYPRAVFQGDVAYIMNYKDLANPLNPSAYKFTASNLVETHKIKDYLKLKYDGPKEYKSSLDFEWLDGTTGASLTPQKPRILDENNVDVTDNYILGYSYYFVLNETITDAGVNITNYEGEFDGQAHTFDIELLVDDPSNFKILYWVLGKDKGWTTQKPYRTNACQEQISVRIENSQGNVVFEGTAGIHITKADPEVQFEDVNFRLGKVYDGKPIENPSITYNGSVAPTVTYTYYRIDETNNATLLATNPVNVGKYRLDVTIPATANYNSVVHSFDVFAITPRTITIHIANQQKLFDNLSWTHKVEDREVENLVKGHTLRLDDTSNNGVLMTTSPEVGEYTDLGVNPGFQWQNAFLRIYDSDGNEVNGPYQENYAIKMVANVQILNRQFSVDFKNKAVYYDGQPKLMSAKINGTLLADGNIDPCIYADFENEVKIEYAVLQNGTYSFEPVEFIQRSGLGVYNVRVRISAPNYETLTKEAKLAIIEPGSPLPPGFDDDDPDKPVDPNDPNYEGPNDADKNPNLDYDSDKIYDGQPFSDPVYNLEPGLNHDIKYFTWEDYVDFLTNNGGVLDPDRAITAPIDAGRYVFVFTVAADANQNAGQVYKQEFKIGPRPVTVTWADLIQQYNGKELVPTATYLDINNQTIVCDVADPQINKNTYDVTASTKDTNYRITNYAEKFVITESTIKDIVLVPPADGYTLNEPVILEDTDGNKYIKKSDFDKDPSIVKDPNHTYLIDDKGDLWKYDPENDTWVPADLPYEIHIDDTYVDPDTGEHKIKVEIDLKNPTDNAWEKNGTDPIKTEFSVEPIHLPSEDYDLVFEYVDLWVHTGSPIEPEVVVYLRELATNTKTVFDKANYVITYNNNVDVTTEDSKAEILFKSAPGSKYFFDDTTQYFTITAAKPDVLELKDDAKIQFIQASYEEGAATIIEDGSVEHLAAGESNLYLGHLHQLTYISDILSQFKNDSSKLVVTDQAGNLIADTDYETIYFGSGYTVSLLDDDGQTIDSIQGILYGDFTSDGVLAADDLVAAQLFILDGMDFADVEEYYFFTGITSRERMLFNTATIVDLQGYLNYAETDESFDFNSFDGKYSNSGSESTEEMMLIQKPEKSEDEL